ncbi:zinc ribbon domain-containing protein [Brytella acorum]
MWNRQRFIKDPDTGKRQARMNPDSEWITHHVPELRILDDDLWETAKARQGALKLRKTPEDDVEENHFRDRRRPKHLFSGLARCSCCGGGYSMISADPMGCSTARNKGTCDNRQNLRRDRLEERALGALRHHMMDPALFREFCDEFTHEANRLRMESSAGISAAKSELIRIDRQITATVDAIADGMFHPSMKEKMDKLEARKSELIYFLKDAQEPPPLRHPEMATYYRVQVATLYEPLQHNDDNTRIQAGGVIRSLVSEIVLTPAEDELLIDLRGDLAGILTLSLKSRTPAPLSRAGVPDAFASQFEMVAGTGHARAAPSPLSISWRSLACCCSGAAVSQPFWVADLPSASPWERSSARCLMWSPGISGLRPMDASRASCMRPS